LYLIKDGYLSCLLCCFIVIVTIIIIIITVVIIIIIIIIHFPSPAVCLLLKTVQVSLNKHFLFTVLPETFYLYSVFEILLLSALEYTQQGGN
jgi:hypothetical protein